MNTSGLHHNPLPPSFSSVALAVLAASALLIGTSIARADPVPPPPPSCPEGGLPSTCHAGPFCAVRDCVDKTECQLGEACENRELCIGEIVCWGYPPTTVDTVEGVCPGGIPCSNGTCETRKVCVTPSGAGGSGGAGGSANGGGGASSGGSTATGGSATGGSAGSVGTAGNASGGTTAAGGSAGTAGTGGSAGTTGSAGSTPTSAGNEKEDSGCGCRLDGQAPIQPVGWALLAVAIVALNRRQTKPGTRRKGR